MKELNKLLIPFAVRVFLSLSYIGFAVNIDINNKNKRVKKYAY